MEMKKFNYTGLWAMLSNPKPTTGSIVKSDAVLSEFSDELHDYCRKEKDFAERTRTLRFARFCCTLSYQSFNQPFLNTLIE